MKIYRFEKNEARRLECIKNGSIYISRPEEFNDLDDCRISGIYTPHYEPEHYNKIKQCLDILYNGKSPYFPLPKELLAELRNFLSHADPSEKDFDQNLKSTLHKNLAVINIRNHLRQKTGVCCFFQGELTHSLTGW